jgi:hypothetical protein
MNCERSLEQLLRWRLAAAEAAAPPPPRAARLLELARRDLPPRVGGGDALARTIVDGRRP